MPPIDALRSRVRAGLCAPNGAYSPQAIQQFGNTGLLLDRYLRERKPPTGGDHKARSDCLNLAARAPAPAGYAEAFRRWEESLAAMGAATVRLRVSGRMIVGLGGESVLESAVTLQRLWGVPYIPGTAVKGLTAHYAAQTLARQANAAIPDPDLLPLPSAPPDAPRRTPSTYGVLFGAVDDAAYLTWFDAWYVPGSAKPDDTPLRRDVITVHHQRYYSTRGAEIENEHEQPVSPWDFDDPNPVPFLSATGDYLFAVMCANAAWHDVAITMLTRAVGEWGIGGKTNAGYGRLHPLPAPPGQQTAQAAPGSAEHPLVAQVRAIPRGNVRQDLNAKYKEWKTLPAGDAKRAVAEAMMARLDEIGVLPEWSHGRGDKPPRAWVAEIAAYLAAAPSEGGAG